MSIVESLPTYGVHYYAVKVLFYYSAFSPNAKHTTWNLKLSVLAFILYILSSGIFVVCFRTSRGSHGG